MGRKRNVVEESEGAPSAKAQQLTARPKSRKPLTFSSPFASLWSRNSPIPIERRVFILVQVFLALSFLLALAVMTKPYEPIRLYSYDIADVYKIPHEHRPVPQLRRILNDHERPNDPLDVEPPFTQGLALCSVPGRDSDGKDVMAAVGVESTGLYGFSIVRIFSLRNGETYEYVRLPDGDFGEGLALLDDDRVVVLTWMEKRVYVIRFNFLTAAKKGKPPRAETAGGQIEKVFTIDFEGWGIASDGRGRFWMTSGGSDLREFVLPHGWQHSSNAKIVPHRTIPLSCFGQPVMHVNELEYQPSSKTIYGNVYGTHLIVEFSVDSGKCKSIMSIAGLDNKTITYDPDNVANGVAFNTQVLGKNGMLVTGKRWPWMYVINKTPVFINFFPQNWNDVSRRIQLV